MDYSQFLYMHEELALLLVIVVMFIYDLVVCTDRKDGKPVLNTAVPVVLMTLLTIFNAIPECWYLPSCAPVEEAFGGMYQHTPMMTVMKTVLNIGTLIVFLMAHRYLRRDENRVKQGEFYILTMSTLLGMYFMISAGHFLMFFIGLELASVPMTALVAYDKWRATSAEAGAKYILVALFSSSLLLYGVSMIYGATGTLYFDDIAARLDGNLLNILGLVFFFTGLAFKISLVPFHLWTADVYEGAPTVVTSYLSVISKGSAAFVLLTILVKVFAPMIQQWQDILFWIIILSITLANIFALRQNNIKRFMAFSAISQAGYLVLGVIAGTAQGMTSLVFYLLVYLAANLGAFAVINSIEQNSGKINISDYNGLYQTNPKLSFLMTLCLFSLAGIPPFAGFFSKFFVFMAAFHQGFHLLVFIALVNTIISLYYYLIIVKAMYINPNDAPIATFRSDGYTRCALFLCTAGVLLLGIVSCVYDSIDALSYGIDVQLPSVISSCCGL